MTLENSVLLNNSDEEMLRLGFTYSSILCLSFMWFGLFVMGIFLINCCRT